MNSVYLLTLSAVEDLDELLDIIAADKPTAASRLEFEIRKTFQLLAKHNADSGDRVDQWKTGFVEDLEIGV